MYNCLRICFFAPQFVVTRRFMVFSLLTAFLFVFSRCSVKFIRQCSFTPRYTGLSSFSSFSPSIFSSSKNRIDCFLVVNLQFPEATVGL